jgi:hypothetical protein
MVIGGIPTIPIFDIEQKLGWKAIASIQALPAKDFWRYSQTTHVYFDRQESHPDVRANIGGFPPTDSE